MTLPRLGLDYAPFGEPLRQEFVTRVMSVMYQVRVDRRAFLLTSVGVLAAPLAAETQQTGKMWRIGTLDYGSEAARRDLWKEFREELHALGYSEGRNMTLESRWANGITSELPRLSADLVRSRPDLIAVAGTPAALAIKQATDKIPVVFVSIGEVLHVGLVPSVGRPGGNITGVATLTTEVSRKWLELLQDAVPITRLGIIWDGGNAAAVVYADEVQKAAQSQNIPFRLQSVRRIEKFEPAVSALKRERVTGLVVVPGPLFFSARATIADITAKHRLATITGPREYAEAGLLMAYGANLAEGFKRAAVYVDKVLKGTKPGDLPIEPPTKFELVINLKTANALGRTIPPSLLMRADRVIE